jgi:SnoaL-like domain
VADDQQQALSRLIAKDEIVDLVDRYSYCVDHRLYDEVVPLLTDDCAVDYGPGFGPPVHGQVALRKMFPPAASPRRATTTRMSS